jgi:hypothetical protein
MVLKLGQKQYPVRIKLKNYAKSAILDYYPR